MLTEDQKRMLISMIENGETVPADYRRLLFATDNAEYVERTGVYSLEYKGKAREQDILADTPAAPLQEIRSFNADNPHPKADWRNLLIYGDNLLALKALYEDQRGANRFGTRDQIKLIYIDPPFATKQDFMKDGETAYRDKLFGAQFIEFLRRRLVLLREILADDGVIFVHLDWKKSHYIKAVMDEIFGEENFRNELYWYYYNKMPDARKSIFPRSTDSLLFYAKNSTGGYFFKSLTEMREKPVEQLVRQKVDGKMINARDANGNIMYQTRNVRIVDNVWRIRLIPPADDRENTGYPTQKPEELLARVLDAESLLMFPP